MSGETPANLVPATFDDFEEGEDVFVRGQRATVVRCDFPLVFYQFEADNGPQGRVLHRSILHSEGVFTIDASNRSSDSSDDEFPSLPNRDSGGGGDAEQEQDGNSEDGTDSSVEADGAENDQFTPAAFLRAMQKRQDAKVVAGLGDEHVTFDDVASTQGLILDSCQSSSAEVPSKVATIMVKDCDTVSLQFESVVAHCEIIRSKECRAECRTACPMWNIEGSTDCTIVFPGTQETVCFVFNATQRVKLIAKRVDDPGGDDEDVEDTLEMMVEEPEHPDDPTMQYRVTWDEDGFSQLYVAGRDRTGFVI